MPLKTVARIVLSDAEDLAEESRSGQFVTRTRWNQLNEDLGHVLDLAERGHHHMEPQVRV